MAIENLAALTAMQHGAFSLAQARESGLGERAVRSRIDRGEWIRLHAGVLALAGAPASWSRSIHAACLAVPSGTVSHESAGCVHDVRYLVDPPIVLTVPHATHRPSSVRIHQSREIGARYVTTLDGLPVTTLARTMFDLAGVLRADRYRRVLDGELARDRVSVPDLVRTADWLCRRGRPGSARFRAELIARSDGLVVGDSKLETAFLDLLRCNRRLLPGTQVRIHWRDRLIGRADFAWETQRLIVELDGRRGHAQLTDFELDRRRDQLAAMAGWTVVRITWTQLTRRPDEVLELIDVLLGDRR